MMNINALDIRKWGCALAFLIGSATLSLAQTKPAPTQTTIQKVEKDQLSTGKRGTTTLAPAQKTTVNRKITYVKVGNPKETAPKTITFQAPVIDPNMPKSTEKKQAIRETRTVTRKPSELQFVAPRRVKKQ